MEIVASCSLEESKNFTGKLGIEGTTDKVSLNVVVNGESEADVFTGVGSNVKFVTFVGSKASYCPTDMSGRVFNQYPYSALEEGTVSPVMGVTDLVVLDDDFSDMRELCEYCEKYPSVRFIGGNLLQVDGVRIGRIGENRDKLPVVFDGVYDNFVEVPLGELEGLSEKVSRARRVLDSASTGEKKKRSTKSGSSKEPKEKKVSKKALSFSALLGNSDEEAF